MKEYSFGVCPYRITSKGTEILMIQGKGRTDWGFIKGKKEPGETPKQTAVRECEEEVGISISTELLEDRYINKNKRKDIEIFLVDDVYIDTDNYELCQKEVADIRWFNINDEIDIQNNQKYILHCIINKFIKRRYYFNGGDSEYI